MNNTLIDNSDEFKLIDYLKRIISDNKYNHIQIATGYWDLPGTSLLYNELKTFLEREGHIDIMIGQEPILRSYQMRGNLTKEETFPDFYIHRDIEKLSATYKPIVQLLLDYINIDNEDQSQIRIRVYGQNSSPKQFLHAKCFIFLGEGFAHGIIGSSNFTEKGLQENAELNYLETNSTIVAAERNQYVISKSHKIWFEEKWEQSEPWSGKFIKEIIKPSAIGTEIEKEKDQLTPYELYIKLLQYKFGDLIDKNSTEIIESYLPHDYNKLEYQIDAVKQCFSIMKMHGGFMLADVVGLGKTIVGTLIIKYFLDYPDDGRERKVLIVTPPAIKSTWQETIDTFDSNQSDKISNYVDFITTGSIGNLVDEMEVLEDTDVDTGYFNENLRSENYGLIIIDESHKFRNSGTAMYQNLDELISQIGSNTGLFPYIGLLSATPQNNTPNDLKNQIYLFERNHNYCTLEKVDGRNLEGFFARISKQYMELRRIADSISANPRSIENSNSELKKINSELISLSQEIRDTILCDILVRRTRTDVNEYYKQKLVFPEVSGPHSLKYKMEDNLARLFADTMELIAPTTNFTFNDPQYLCYYRYQAIRYFKDNNLKAKYKGKNMDADRFSRQLAKIMQILLVKRIESSFTAFKASLHNLRRYTKNMIDMWEHDAIFICPQIDVNAELNIRKKKDKDSRSPLLTFEKCADDIRAKIKKLNKSGRNEDKRNHEYRHTDFEEEYIKRLRTDYELINDLCEQWDAYNYDPKLEVFKDNLLPVLFDKERNPNQKLVIFSEAIDTVKALKVAVEYKGFKGKVLAITAKNRKEQEQTIKENFDANYNGEKKNDYQVIITTEVLAEGINLHRANCILNYDTPWNSTRLMQRIGRVNRIGTTSKYIYVYNFMPSAQGNELIQLIQKAYMKLQSFHVLFGEDSKIFSEDEDLRHYDLNKIVNGEESPYEKFVYELKRFRESNPKRYEVIKSRNENLETAIGTEGNRYFVVRTPQMSGLFVRVLPNGKGEVISALDMYNEFVTPQQTTSVKLPTDWNASKKIAERTLGQHLTKMNIYAARNESATKAKKIINDISDSNNLSAESQLLLNEADKLIRKGNTDMIKRILLIGKELSSKQLSLFEMQQSDIDYIIKNTIKRLITEQAKQTGKPSVFIGLSK